MPGPEWGATHMPPLTLHCLLRPWLLAAGCRLPPSAGQERGELCRGNQGLGGVNRVISLERPQKRRCLGPKVLLT